MSIVNEAARQLQGNGNSGNGGNGNKVSHFFEKNAQNIFMLCGMLVAGASAYTELAGRVQMLEDREREKFKAVESRLTYLEKDTQNSLKETDIEVLKTQIHDMLREQDTLYLKSEGALTYAQRAEKELYIKLHEEISALRTDLARLTGEVQTSHKRNGH